MKTAPISFHHMQLPEVIQIQISSLLKGLFSKPVSFIRLLPWVITPSLHRSIAPSLPRPFPLVQSCSREVVKSCSREVVKSYTFPTSYTDPSRSRGISGKPCNTACGGYT